MVGSDIHAEALLPSAQFMSPERSLGYAFAAAGGAGVVALWDARSSGRQQTASLAAPRRSGALHALALADGGRRVLAGSDAGELVGWDLRGGRSSGRSFGAAGATSHPPLLSIPLDTMARSISGAGAQVTPQRRCMHRPHALTRPAVQRLTDTAWG